LTWPPLPLGEHQPGQDAEVDFADLWVRLDGEPTRWFLFTLRLSCSGKAVHRVFPSQGQEAFLEGHQYAFEVLDGVPAGQVRYDNLKSAVSRVLFGRNRTESQRWIAFRSHYEVGGPAQVLCGYLLGGIGCHQLTPLGPAACWPAATRWPWRPAPPRPLMTRPRGVGPRGWPPVLAAPRSATRPSRRAVPVPSPAPTQRVAAGAAAKGDRP